MNLSNVKENLALATELLKSVENINIENTDLSDLSAVEKISNHCKNKKEKSGRLLGCTQFCFLGDIVVLFIPKITTKEFDLITDWAKKNNLDFKSANMVGSEWLITLPHPITESSVQWSHELNINLWGDRANEDYVSFKQYRHFLKSL